MKIILIVILIVYSVFAMILTLKVGKLKEDNKTSFAYKFLYYYGKVLIILLPFICVFLLLVT